MTPEERQEFQQMKRELRELLEWKATKERQQISLPLDDASFGVLNQAFYNRTFDQINAKTINDV